MLCPSLWQYGALPAGSSWQLQERSLPGGNSEVLRQVWSSYYLDYVCLICCFQLHVLNEKFKNKEWTLKLIFIGHFCGVKDWDLPFSVQISEVRKWKGSRFLHILSPWTSATQQMQTMFAKPSRLMFCMFPTLFYCQFWDDFYQCPLDYLIIYI